MTLAKLEQELERVARDEEKEWTPIGQPGIRKAIKKYCSHFDLEVPEGESGRPKKT